MTAWKSVRARMIDTYHLPEKILEISQDLKPGEAIELIPLGVETGKDSYEPVYTQKVIVLIGEIAPQPVTTTP